MITDSNFRARNEYNRMLLKEAQDTRRVRLAGEWIGATKNPVEQAPDPSRVWQGSPLLRPALRIVEFILITLGI